MLKYLCLTAIFLPTIAAAQVGPELDNTSFDTRDDAIDALLPDNQSELGGCNLGVSSSDLTGPNAKIGEDLARHCASGNNESSGVALGGGVGSLQPFRTVAIPELDRAQEEGSGEPQAVLNFLGVRDEDLALRFAAPGSQFFLNVERNDFTLAGTRYGARAEADGLGLTFGGVSTNMDSGRAFGAVLTYKDYEGRLASDLNTAATFIENEELTNMARDNGVTFSDICGIPGGGTHSSRRLEFQVFGREVMKEGIFIDYGIGASRSRDSYAVQNCLVNAFDDIGDQPFLHQVSAGTLSGEPITRQLNAFAKIGKRLPVGDATFIPSARFELAVSHRSGYAESELPAGSTINFPGLEGGGDVTDGDPTVPLGTALVFDESQTTQAALRLGLDVEVPFQIGLSAGTLRLGGGVTRLFGDGQERVTARFRQDGRDNPTKFSFLERPVDRTWGDVAVGINLPVGDRGRIDVGAETIVRNDFVDHMTIHAGFAMTF